MELKTALKNSAVFLIIFNKNVIIVLQYKI